MRHARGRPGRWPRRALFQVHLWTGLIFALYVLVVSLSGSAIVFRHEMDHAFCEPAFVSRLADLHDDLLGGEAGRAVNGLGAVLVVLMCLSGAVIWWPGTSRWWRSATLWWNVHWRRFTFDLHNVLGFWGFALILMWAVSGIYFAFPNSIYKLADFVIAHGSGRVTSDTVDNLIDVLVRLHFGRAFGLWVKVLWVLLGLVPPALIVTGALMWWNRVLRRTMGRSGEVPCQGVPDASASSR